MFLTAAELDDRLSKTKIISWAYLGSRRAVMSLVLVVFIALSSLFFSLFGGKGIDLLEQLHREGKMTDPIDAMIFLERNRYTFRGSAMPMMLAMAAPLLFIFGGVALLAKLFPAYNFCWGDYVPVFEKRKSMTRVFWTVVVLGLLVSLAAGVIQSRLTGR